jgi:hypothetical protein
MTLEERLTQAGVTTLAELEAKIKTDTAAEVKATALAEEAKLRKQITDLETIKASQGGEIGELRKNKEALAEAERKLADFEKSKKTGNEPPKDPPTEKSEDAWKQENSEREKAFKDDDWNKVDAAMKAAPPEAKALIKTEAGRAAFYDRVLGSTSTQEAQETLRRPVQKAQLTVAEQLDAYLNKGKQPVRIPARQPSGIVPSKPNPNQNQSGEPVAGASFAQRMAGIQTQ